MSNKNLFYVFSEVPDHVVRHNTPCYNQTPVCLSPVVKAVECHHTRPCPGSRDSGCYASSEHIYPREGFHKLLLNTQPVPQAFVERQYSPMHSNKENLKPSNMYRTGNKGGKSSSDSRPESCKSFSVEDKISDLDKSDREYTEEDKEVFEITRNSEKQKESSTDFISNDENKIVTDSSLICDGPNLGNMDTSFCSQLCADSNFVMCSCAGTQTSPKHSGNICDNDVSDIQYGGSRHHSEPSEISETRTKPQPFPRRTVTKHGALRDAQVQVMCPLGNFNTMKNSQSAERTLELSSLPQSPNSNKEATCNGVIVDPKVHSSVGKRKPVPNRRTKSMDDTNQGPVHSHKEFRSIKKSLINQVTSKLASERIDLSQEPYTSEVSRFL